MAHEDTVTGGRNVDDGLYSAETLRRFAGEPFDAFVDSGGHPLRPRVARALALAELAPGQRVVDVGTGRGEAALHCRRRGCQVLAVDRSVTALRLARQVADLRRPGQPPPTGDIAHLLSPAERLPVPDGWADRILFLDVVEHLTPSIVAASLGEIRRILAPGGRVVIHTLPNRWALDIGYRMGRRLFGLPREPRSEYERRVHINEQSPRSLARAVRLAGLSYRVWVEEWTTHYARTYGGDAFPDTVRRRGYRVLERDSVRRLVQLAMATPLRWVLANDIYAVAWLPRDPAPESPRLGTGRRPEFRRTSFDAGFEE